jgi:hypothetical protein
LLVVGIFSDILHFGSLVVGEKRIRVERDPALGGPLNNEEVGAP